MNRRVKLRECLGVVEEQRSPGSTAAWRSGVAAAARALLRAEQREAAARVLAWCCGAWMGERRVAGAKI